MKRSTLKVLLEKHTREDDPIFDYLLDGLIIHQQNGAGPLVGNRVGSVALDSRKINKFTVPEIQES